MTAVDITSHAFPEPLPDDPQYWSDVPPEVSALAAEMVLEYKRETSSAEPDWMTAWKALLRIGAMPYRGVANLPERVYPPDQVSQPDPPFPLQDEIDTVLEYFAASVTPREAVAWRRALLVTQSGYNVMQPLALRLAYVRAIDSWKRAGRTIQDLNPRNPETRWLRAGVALDEIAAWQSAYPRQNLLEQPGFEAFVAEGGTPEYAAEIQRHWREAKSRGVVEGDFRLFEIGWAMKFACALPGALPFHLGDWSPRIVCADEIEAYFGRRWRPYTDAWDDSKDAASQGITVDEMFQREAWEAVHGNELKNVSGEMRTAYRYARIPPWEIRKWEDRMAIEPGLRNSILRHVPQTGVGGPGEPPF
ncbi:hypothetical protein [Actinoplanes sp. NPDC049802]|uniref:hypothetical protein n=1 Tax=Actinoplanes sp. NPDC049802 TaxID=3154742 RepID=UPI0033C9F9AA